MPKTIKRLNEHAFNLLVLIVGIVSTYLTVGGEHERLQIIAILFLKIGIYLNLGSLFVEFLNGLGRDMKKEIFDEHNVAAAIFIAGFWIGLAISIFTGA